MAVDYRWNSMDAEFRKETVALWVRQGTPPEGIAHLCDTSVETIDVFIAEKLPNLKNQYEANRPTLEKIKALREGDDYPPFNFKDRR